MEKYEYSRIAKLTEKLSEAGVEPRVIDEIMKGGETIRRGTKPEKKADWLCEAMHRMDQLLDRSTRQAVRENCA
jgi:hypothetical protein